MTNAHMLRSAPSAFSFVVLFISGCTTLETHLTIKAFPVLAQPSKDVVVLPGRISVSVDDESLKQPVTSQPGAPDLRGLVVAAGTITGAHEPGPAQAVAGRGETPLALPAALQTVIADRTGFAISGRPAVLGGFLEGGALPGRANAFRLPRGFLDSIFRPCANTRPGVCFPNSQAARRIGTRSR